ncbi:molybdenum ABC transporter substrate-binding protein [Stenotrophomonas sp. MYb238]|nr:molybdenum ABC transporter substrate-binding protein [Stenotrophomonas sp. MYb238]
MTQAPMLTGISSMATRQVLAALAARCAHETGIHVEVESCGGVEAARRVAAGEAFDVVWLASDALEKLAASGRIIADSRVELLRSETWVAVRKGAARPDIGSEAAVREAVLRAKTLGHSTGPSGAHINALLERWGIAGHVAPRIVQAPPGMPVATLIARGEIELGFQQRSEIEGIEGVDAAGPLPAAIAKTTTFAGAVCACSRQPAHARALLAFMALSANDAVKRGHGMEPA